METNLMIARQNTPVRPHLFSPGMSSFSTEIRQLLDGLDISQIYSKTKPESSRFNLVRTY